jgi:hypothetical protein
VRSIVVRAVVIVALMACAAAPTAVVTNRGTEGHGPPRLFAPLFREGASWRFTAETRITDDNGHHEVRPGVVTCAISHVRETANTWLAELRCRGIETDQPIDGTLVATRAGLWHFDHAAVDPRPDTMAIAAEPRDGAQHQRDLGSGETEVYSVTRVGDHWCFTYNTNQGDDRAWMLCIREEAGIVGGSSYFMGGQVKLTSFGDVHD